MRIKSIITMDNGASYGALQTPTEIANMWNWKLIPLDIAYTKVENSEVYKFDKITNLKKRGKKIIYDRVIFAEISISSIKHVDIEL